MSYEFTVSYHDDPIIPGRAVDIMQPRTVTREVALFFVHGGGWESGHRDGFHPIMHEYVRAGFICATAGYRLGGVNALDQLSDVRHGYDTLVTFLKQAGRPLRVVVYGVSAGAHLAALLSLAGPGECGESLAAGTYMIRNAWVAPVGMALQSAPVCFMPWEDMFPPIWRLMQRIAGTPYADNPELYRRLSPISYVRADSCPVLLMEAGNEHMFPRRLAQEFAGRLRGLNRRVELIVYPEVEHGFFYELVRRQQRQAFADLLDFAVSLEAEHPSDGQGA